MVTMKYEVVLVYDASLYPTPETEIKKIAAEFVTTYSASGYGFGDRDWVWEVGSLEEAGRFMRKLIDLMEKNWSEYFYFVDFRLIENL
jgi:hypothetical protein